MTQVDARPPGSFTEHRSRTAALSRALHRAAHARVWREPLLHFLALGAVIFAVAQWRDQASDPHRILVDRERVARLTQSYAQQYGETPTARTLNGLIDRYVEQEAFYREGKAMGLDQEDEVVRRRIVQKTEFLKQDLNPPAEPDEAALRRYYDAHAARYRSPKRVAFSHVYFSADAGGDAAAQARATIALAGLTSDVTRAPERGDRFPDLYDYAGLSAEDAAKVFGRSAFVDHLFDSPAGRWAGPFKSGYGWHLLRVSSVITPVQRSFEDARADVRADYLADARDAANRRTVADLMRRYHVVLEKGAHP